MSNKESRDTDFNGKGKYGEINWEQKYLEGIEQQLRDIKAELLRSEGRTHEVIRDAMNKVYFQSDQRHREYLAVIRGMDDLIKHVDRKQGDLNKWITKTAITVILGVASLVSAGVFGIVKLMDSLP